MATLLAASSTPPVPSSSRVADARREEMAKGPSRSMLLPLRDFEAMLLSNDTVICTEGRDVDERDSMDAEEDEGEQQQSEEQAEDGLAKTSKQGHSQRTRGLARSNSSRRMRYTPAQSTSKEEERRDGERTISASHSLPLLSNRSGNSRPHRRTSVDSSQQQQETASSISDMATAPDTPPKNRTLVSSRAARASAPAPPRPPRRPRSLLLAPMTYVTMGLDKSLPSSPVRDADSPVIALFPARRSFDSMVFELDDRPKSAFQSTMRKTSQFFRKFGGTAKSSSSSGSPSLARSASTRKILAPVEFPSAPTPPRTSSAHSPPLPTNLLATPLPIEPFASPVLDLSLGVESTVAASRRTHARNRSLSLDAATIRQSTKRSDEHDLAESTSSSGYESPTDLTRWKADLNGAIGSIGIRDSPSPPRTSSKHRRNTSRSVPNLVLASLTASPTSTVDAIRAIEDAVLSKAESPLSALFRSVDMRMATLKDDDDLAAALNAASVEGQIVEQAGKREVEQDSSTMPPTIRLIVPASPERVIQDTTNTPQRARSTLSHSSKRHSVVVDLPGLETITELSHSRESSATEAASSSPLSDSLPSQLLELQIAAASDALQAVSSSSASSLPSPPRVSSPSSLGASLFPTEAISLEEQAEACAKQCWDEDESFLDRRKIAEWLGSAAPLRAMALEMYMNYFDFSDLRLDLAFRRLCDRLYLKAESQQVDRILGQFSRRYWENNPQTIYGSQDAVYAVSYAIMLLNTDLHVADISKRMSRHEFLENTLSTITGRTDIDISPGILSTSRSSAKLSLYSVFGGGGGGEGVSSRSLDRQRDSSPSSASFKVSNQSTATLTPSLSVSPMMQSSSAMSTVDLDEDARVESMISSVASETDLIALLKDIYNAVKAQPVAQSTRSNFTLSDGRSSLSIATAASTTVNSTLIRSSSRRSTSSSSSSSAFKRSSIRGFNSFIGHPGFTRSASSSTITSLSDQENVSTAYASKLNHRSYATIGFASNLSQTMVIQEHEDTNHDNLPTDEELALSGAPWAKEGIIQRKHFWESTLKRAKDKAWLQVFVVIAKGELSMFRFDGGGTVKSPSRKGDGFGGGDWMSNANSVGQISLVHALTSSLAAPGYNKSRPHCFVLTLPEGGTYFFEAGTPDLIVEWVSTCNYWSARCSKQPLSGGLSSMQYGWNLVSSEEMTLAAAEVEADLSGSEREGTSVYKDMEDISSIRSGRSGRSETSRQSKFSYRSFSNSATSSSLMPPSTTYASPLSIKRKPSGQPIGDRMHLSDWKAPNVPMGTSALSEEAQLGSLRKHTAISKAELAHHNTLRAPMLRHFSTDSPNYRKAEENWKLKSQHLLTEVVKYQTYVDALTSAIELRTMRAAEKETSEMLEAADSN